MTAVSSVQPTGDAYIDGVLSGLKWASNSLTFSFPTDSTYYGTGYGGGEPSNNFEAFTVQQQDAVRAILQMYSSVANLTFTEVTETSTQHGELRYAESDGPGTAWAYYPNTSSIGGDAWFNNSRNYYDSPIKGNYAYLTMMHETGHALGLKHPHEVKGSFGVMPAEHDSLEYSVMSYHSYVGSSLSGYTNATYSYPQTLMMYDIAALQEMYGANYSTNSGNTVYTWSSTTGQMFVNGVGQGAPGGNTIFMTVWDGGGNDTYDFSNYATSLNVDLNPGSWTTASTAQLATLAYGHVAVGNIANALLYQDNPASLIENAVGGSGNDVLIGNMASNRLTGGRGNDQLDGGTGTDTAVYSAASAYYSWIHNADGSWTITDLRTGGPDGTDTLIDIEQLQFSDMLLAIDGYALPPVNHAPTITSAAQSAWLTEWADLSANEVANAPHTATGLITFLDADATDLHAATVAAQGSNYLGALTLNTSTIDSNDSLSWSFSVSDSAIDALAQGQTLTQLYNVTVNDGHGGTATQTITIALVGADDPVSTNHAPTITSAPQSASLTEWANLSVNEVANTPHTATGLITFIDSDATDFHTATVVAQGSNYLGALTLNTSTLDSSDSLGWSFSVSDSAMDYLKVGQKLTQLYNVTIDDGHGGFATQTITITLGGADDPITRTSPGKGKKAGGADMIDGSGHDGTPAEFHSRSEVVGMSGDQAQAPIESTEVISLVGVQPLDHDFLLN